MAKLTVRVTGTAANTNALSATDLQTTPGPGLVQMWLASTVQTATVSITQGRENIARAIPVPKRTDGEPSLYLDPPIAEIPSGGGEQNVVNVGGTTGTWVLVALFTPEEEL